jgi:pyruvate,orthophosphate dikinase
MPGMMDTILNLGLNDAAAEGLAASTGNRRFAYDSYRRLIQMYGEVVDGIDAALFENAFAERKRERRVEQDVELTADDLAAIEDAIPRDAAAGARDPEARMASLDSER